MLEIILLVIAVGGVASLARGRGGKPVLWGAIAAVGYVLTAIAVLVAMGGSARDSIVPRMIAPWFWIAAVAFYLRFGLGSQYAQPDSQWSCASCHTLNKRSSVICEACKQPWETQQSRS
jgi:hypothetical protein